MSQQPPAHSVTEAVQILDLGEGTSRFLDYALPGRSKRKRVMRMLDCSESTARRLLAGARPTGAQVEQLFGIFGHRFTDFVFGRGAWSDASVEARVARLEVGFAALRTGAEGTDNADVVATAPAAVLGAASGGRPAAHSGARRLGVVTPSAGLPPPAGSTAAAPGSGA